MITEIKNAWIIPNEKEKFYGSLFIKDEKILGYQYSGKVDKTIDGKGNIVIPGLIDIHFHGSHGYDFISNPKESVYEISKQLVYEGTTSFMASLTVISHEEMISLLEKLNLVDSKVLLVVEELNDNVCLASRNLGNVKVVLPNEVCTYDVVNCDKLVITNEALSKLEEVLSCE